MSTENLKNSDATSDNLTIIIPLFLQNSLRCFKSKPDDNITHHYNIKLVSPENVPLYVNNEVDLRDVLKQYCLFKQLCSTVNDEMARNSLEFKLDNKSVRLVKSLNERQPLEFNVKRYSPECQMECGQQKVTFSEKTDEVEPETPVAPVAPPPATDAEEGEEDLEPIPSTTKDPNTYIILPQFLQNSLDCFNCTREKDITHLFNIVIKSENGRILFIEKEVDLRETLKQYCLFQQMRQKLTEERVKMEEEFQLSNKSFRVGRSKRNEERPLNFDIPRFTRECDVQCGLGPDTDMIRRKSCCTVS